MKLPLQMPRPHRRVSPPPPGNSDRGYVHLNSICQSVSKADHFLPCNQAYYGANGSVQVSTQRPGNRRTGPHTSPASPKCLFALVNSESKLSHHRVLLNPMDRFLPPTVFKNKDQKSFPHQWLLLTIIRFSEIIYFTENSLSSHFQLKYHRFTLHNKAGSFLPYVSIFPKSERDTNSQQLQGYFLYWLFYINISKLG